MFTNMEMVKQIAEHKVKITPDILVTGQTGDNASNGLLNVLLSRTLANKKNAKIVE